MLVEKHRGIADATEGFAVQSRQYRVDSPALVFDVLCNKMYSNPLSTMIQEYLANARDAHREVRNLHIPIQVTMPTTLDSHLSIRDFGPGLTEQRIDDVFVSLGSSTKNESDEMTGGFGLGAKIGWAYGDSFTVISVVDGVQSTYLAYLDAEGIGRMDTIGVETTEEANGVTIKVFIKSTHHYQVEDIIEKVTYFWDVPPVSTSCTFGNYGGQIQHPVLYIETPFSLHGYIYAVVDGIPYLVSKNLIPITSSLNLPGNSSSLFLFFDVSEIDVAINREGLRYSTKTIDNITHSIMSVSDSNAAAIDIAVSCPKFTDKLKTLQTCYSQIGAPSTTVTEILPYVYLKFTYYVHKGAIVIMRPSDGSSSDVSIYSVRKTEKVRKDIAVRQTQYADRLSDSYVVGAKNLMIKGVTGLSYNFPIKESVKYVFFGKVDTASVPFINKCRTLCQRLSPSEFSFIAVTNKSVYDFLVRELGFIDISYVSETPAVRITRTGVGGSRACNFLETDVKSVFSRTDTMNIDAFINASDTIWCAFRESSEVREKMTSVRRILPEFAKLRCYYLTAPQIQYVNSRSAKKQHYLEAYASLKRRLPMFIYAQLVHAFSRIDTHEKAAKYAGSSTGFQGNTTLAVLASRMGEFSSDHLLPTYILSVAESMLVEHVIVDILDRLRTYQLQIGGNSRMLRYYEKYCKRVTERASTIKTEFYRAYPLLEALSTYYRYSTTTGKRASNQLIEYLQTADVK